MTQGEASSWRRNRVYAWMSTVRPLSTNDTGRCTGTGALLSALALAPFGAGATGGGVGAARARSTSQV